MNTQTKFIAAATAGLALTAISATAATTILSEDWQNPSVANGLRVGSTGGETNQGFTGWTFPGNNVNRISHHGSSAAPQDGLSPNQTLQFEWADAYSSYDTTHNWASDDVYNVSFNATETSWSGTSDRYIGIRIRETGGGLLWQGHVAQPEYDAAHAGAGDVWSAAQTFSMDFSAADFGTVFQTGAGTEGTLITFEVGGVSKDLVDGSSYANSNRGNYVDNIEFTLVPEPTTTALLGLGGLALILRRRK